MSTPPLLTTELLERFAAAAAAAGLPVVNDMDDGLTDAQQDELLVPVGHSAPDELRALWGWQIPSRLSQRDGAEMTPARTIAPTFELLRPAEAVELIPEHLSLLEFAPDQAPWLAIGRWESVHGYFYVDCSSQVGPCAVGVRFREDPDVLPAFPSLGAFFERCIQGLRDGEYGMRDGELWADEDRTGLHYWHQI